MFKKLGQFLLIFIVSVGWIFSGWPQIFNPSILFRTSFPPEVQVAQAATETKWASSHITGGCTNPNNAISTTDGIWTGEVNANISCISRYALEDPSGGITGTQTISVIARKGSNSNNPTLAVNLYENGSLVQSVVGGTSITSTSGQTVSGTFDASAITNQNNVEIEIVVTGAGGSGSARNSAQFDSIDWTVNLAVTNQITVGTSGTQNSSLLIPSNDQHIGGTFTFVRTNATADVTSITITETGTVNANSNISDVRLYYKQEATCSSSIPGDATLFNSTGGTFNASEKSTVTGTMTVGTSQICVYAQLDVGSGASNGNTLEIEISDPSTEVSVSSGATAPNTAVAISGSTTLNLAPNVFIDHYRWRNDNGPQGNQVQTLYFNPTGNGFAAQSFSIVSGCSVAIEWDCVDDGSADTESSAPTSDLETSELLLASGKSYYTLADDALLSGSTITQLDITVAGADDIGNPNTSVTLGYCITCDGFNDIMGSAQNITGADQTKTEQFTGLNLSTTDLNNLELVVQGSGNKAQISTVYVLVSYSVPEATWAQNEDIAHTNLSKNTNIRLRFQIDNTGGSASNYNYRLEYAEQSGTCDTAYSGESYIAVPDTATTQHFDMTLSGAPGYVDGDPTTAKLSNGESLSFVAGNTVESTSNQSSAISLVQNEYTEVEYVFQANSNATDGGVYCFRVTDAGTALDSADVVAQVTIASGGAVYSIAITSSGSIEYGFVELSTATSTVGNGYTQTAQNDGNTTEKLNVKSSNATGGTAWTLAGSIGSDQYKHEFSTTTGSTWTAMTAVDTYVTAAPSVAVSGTVNFDFRLTTPSASTDYQQKSITITIQAVAP